MNFKPSAQEKLSSTINMLVLKLNNRLQFSPSCPLTLSLLMQNLTFNNTGLRGS